VRVVPFKSQNMALNSAVTPDGLELGRAQAVQAEAAWLEPAVEMNPILLKPEGDRRSQVVVMGKPIGSLTAVEYHAYKPELEGIIAECLGRLRRDYELVLIEGAGSPAEINLKSRDIVNMHVARVADAPVLLCGDIDRGGVFAAFVGTLALLEPDERARVAAFVINKFRGDPALLTPGLVELSQRTGKPVLGVVPYVPRLRIADEDSLSLDQRMSRARPGASELDIVVIRLPRISNHDDVEALEHEPGVVVRFVERPEQARGADLVILPGSKHTTGDLAWLRSTGLAALIQERAARAEPVLGICGGCQMLGLEILDPERVESSEARVAGLGLLPIRTRFASSKRTARVRCVVQARSFLGAGVDPGQELEGYEIHMGRLEAVSDTRAAAFRIVSRNARAEPGPDGAVDATGAVVGSMIHGLLENDALRASLLGQLRRSKGLAVCSTGAVPSKQAEYDRIEATIREHLDAEMLWRLAGLTRG
jgi:adenosylcobyric acid synthase